MTVLEMLQRCRTEIIRHNNDGKYTSPETFLKELNEIINELPSHHPRAVYIPAEQPKVNTSKDEFFLDERRRYSIRILEMILPTLNAGTAHDLAADAAVKYAEALIKRLDEKR